MYCHWTASLMGAIVNEARPLVRVSALCFHQFFHTVDWVNGMVGHLAHKNNLCHLPKSYLVEQAKDENGGGGPN